MDLEDRARSRFDRLRTEAADGYGAAVADRWQPPAGVCLSTVARVVVQPGGAGVRAEIATVQSAVEDGFDFDPYRAEALHVSLLGCSPRLASAALLTDRVMRVADCVRDVLSGGTACSMELGRLNVIGVQAFIEVLPLTGEWARLRTELGARLEVTGESPIRYADPEPVHLNIGRFGGTDAPGRVAELVAGGLGVDATLHIEAIELVITDFSLSAGSFEVLERLPLPAT